MLVALVALALVFTACDWTMFGFNASRTRYNSGETTISVSNVSSLVMRFYATAGDKADSSPAVSGGVLYVGSDDHKLYAVDAGGQTDCTTGTPAVCAPLWTAFTGGDSYTSPAVSNGVVYVGSTDGLLYAFSAAGTTNCSGTPLTCSPLWTANTGGSIGSSPVVSNGDVYVEVGGYLDAYSAARHHELLGHSDDVCPAVEGRHGGGHFLAGRE